MSAAVELAELGLHVTVFEAARQLGGRARAVERNGTPLDNGQHILVGAYHETLRLMHKVGVDVDKALLRLPLRLEIADKLHLAAPRLPAPLHLLVALLTAKGLNWKERFAALKLMASLKHKRFRLPGDMPLVELLAEQPDKLVRLLWEPLCLATLNTPIAYASAQVFCNVLRDCFSHSRTDSDLLLPRTDLSALFPQTAATYLEQRGGQVRLGVRVASIATNDGGIIIDGESFSHAVCAVSPYALPQLLGNLPKIDELLEIVGGFRYQPIATVYLQYPETVHLSFPMLGLANGHAQWVFDRGTLSGTRGLLAVVISAEGPHIELDREQLAAVVHDELQEALGPLPAPLWQQVIVEKRATFACTNNLRRPSQQTENKRIFIAGDYISSDYPATLEGAVRSGVQCAHSLYASLS